MMRKWMGGVTLALPLLLAAWAVWANLAGEEPAGTAPFGFAFAEDAAGQQFEGVVVNELTGIPRGQDGTPLGAAEVARAVIRLRKGTDLHAFFGEYRCGDACSADPCREFLVCAIGRANKQECTTRTLLDQGLIGELQTCIEETVEDDIVAAFGLDPAAQVRLKNISEFVTVVGFTGDGQISVFSVADIEVTAK